MLTVLGATCFRREQSLSCSLLVATRRRSRAEGTEAACCRVRSLAPSVHYLLEQSRAELFTKRAQGKGDELGRTKI